MKTREKLIEEFLKTPWAPGEFVNVQGMNYRAPQQWAWAKLEKVEGDTLHLSYEGNKTFFTRQISEVERVTDFVGLNPFEKELRGNAQQSDIEQILHYAGWEFNEARHTSTGVEELVQRVEELKVGKVPEVCYNPMVINDKGEEIEYQRGLVWSELQKQLLIMSIWNQIEIGKVVVRKRSYNWVEKRLKEGKIEHTAFADLVDGKQRVNAILSYIRGEFADLNGIYWYDLSESAKRKFMSYRNVTLVQMDENSSDADVLKTFLAINFTGVPMSMEHIKFVQSIKI